MLRYLCLLFCLIVVAVICFDAPVAETENADEVQSLKEQVEELKAQVATINVQVKDLYFMTEPLRILVGDRDGGNYYHARRHTERDSRSKMWGMLPSQLPQAKARYELRWAPDFGYSKEEIQKMADKYMAMPRNPYLNWYKPYYNFEEHWLDYNAISGLYSLPVGFVE